MVNDLTENIKFLASYFNNPQISPLKNTRKYSEDTGLGKQKWKCFFSRYNSTNFTFISEKSHHILLKILIAVAKKNRQVTCMYVLFGNHNYMLDILKKYCYVFSGQLTEYFLF